MTKLQNILQLLCAYGRAEILNDFTPNCCIESARIADMVLTHFRIPSRPLPTTAGVFNKALADWIAAGGDLPTLTAEKMDEFGGWVVKIGDTGEKIEGGWDGHLATLVEERVLLDLSIDQANRPAKGIEVTPLAAPVPPEFVRGEEAVTLSHKKSGCLIRYHTLHRIEYGETPAWRRLSDKRVVADRIIWRMERALDRMLKS